jgi:flagellar biosynthesis/type III secretory pathway chaperone
VLDLIVTNLEELVHIQKQLINYSERKKSVLIERKVDELNQIVQEEAKLVKQLGKLENERKQQAESLLEKHPSLTFIEFVEAIPDCLKREKVISLIDALQQLTLELQSINKVNEQILKDSLSFVQHMIDQVTHSQQHNFNYQSPLRPQNSQASRRGFFDTKA